MDQNKTRKVTWTTVECLDAAIKYSTRMELKNDSVNAKSKIELSKKTLVKYAEMVALEESKKPWRFCDSVNGSMSGKEKRWVIDIDDCESGFYRGKIITKIQFANYFKKNGISKYRYNMLCDS